MTHTAANIALLAPVPLEHLTDGQMKIMSDGKVAFGSKAFERFLKRDELRKGLPVDVYIYKSHGQGQYALNLAGRAGN